MHFCENMKKWQERHNINDVLFDNIENEIYLSWQHKGYDAPYEDLDDIAYCPFCGEKLVIE